MLQLINFLFRLFDTSDFSIQEITAKTKFTRHWKVRNQIDTIKRLMTKLKNSVKDRNQIRSLLIIKCKFKFLFFTYELKVIIKNYYLSK